MIEAKSKPCGSRVIDRVSLFRFTHSVSTTYKSQDAASHAHLDIIIMTINIFMTGITGYIGGAVLQHFLRHADASSFAITALIRSADKAEKLKAFGVNAVVGSLTDFKLVEKLASEADIVIAMVWVLDT